MVGSSLGPPSPVFLLSVETGQDEPVSGYVVDAVSAVSDTPPTELPLLNDAVDPDALDRLFSGRLSEGLVSFRYAGYIVSVLDGEVRVYEDR